MKITETRTILMVANENEDKSEEGAEDHAWLEALDKRVHPTGTKIRVTFEILEPE